MCIRDRPHAVDAVRGARARRRHPAPERVAEHYGASRRGPVPPPWTAFHSPSRDAIDHLAAGRVHQPDPRRDRAPRLRAEEPRAHQPVTDAHATTRQPPRRRQRLRQTHPGVPGSQSRPPERCPPCGHRRRSDRVTTVIIAKQRISGCTLTLRMHPEMRWGAVPIAYQILLVTAVGVICLLYTSDAADDLTRVDIGGRRI